MTKHPHPPGTKIAMHLTEALEVVLAMAGVPQTDKERNAMKIVEGLVAHRKVLGATK